MAANDIISVKDLHIRFQQRDKQIYAVNGVSFTLRQGQTLGIVGESGSGKTQTALSLIRLLEADAQLSGEIKLYDENIYAMSMAQLNALRGNKIAMIFQDPMTSLNPYLTIATQLCEVLQIHQNIRKDAARARALAYLQQVRISDAQRRLDQYPHELSGGMRQRVMIAMALIREPEILIADEPTTALDVTVQAEIMQLLRQLKDELKLSMILISHDLGVIAGLCDQVMVMYAGEVVEHADVETLFAQPQHPYTRGLLRSVRQTGNELYSIPGQPPDLTHKAEYCCFAERCEEKLAICTQRKPTAVTLSAQQYAACFLLEQ